MLYFQDTTRRDARKVVASLRPIDRFEAEHLHGLETDKQILDLIMCRPSYTIRLGQVPVGLFGVAGFGEVGVPWLVGTPLLTTQSKEFLRASRQLFTDLVRPFDYITNTMLRDNGLHRRWAEWLGITSWEDDVHNGVEIVRFTQCVYQPQQLLLFS